MRPIFYAALCISTVLPAGCPSNGDLLTPEVAGAGTAYVLRSAGGTPIPAVWISNQSVTVTVVADTIRLRSDGRGDRVLLEEYRDVAPGGRGGPARRREAGGFDYVRRGDRIEITLPCPDLGLCVASPHFIGQVTLHGLTFDRALNYRTPLRYDRVGR
jgi:hypothetical protein